MKKFIDKKSEFNLTEVSAFLVGSKWIKWKTEIKQETQKDKMSDRYKERKEKTERQTYRKKERTT